MCQGFSGFYSKDGRVFFSAPDNNGDCSHSDCADRLQEKEIPEDEIIAFEYPIWTLKSFHWDFDDISKWANKSACHRVMREVKPIWKEYKNAIAPAQAEYENVRAPALAEYKKVWDAARAEYKKVVDAALTEMTEKLRRIDGFCE